MTPVGRPAGRVAPAALLLAAVLAAAFVSSEAPLPDGNRPRRSTAATNWCPDVALAGGWDPVLRRILDEGPDAPGDSGVPENTPPPWMDKRRYEAGKAFVRKYSMAIVFAHMHALLLLLAVPSVLNVLVYTDNSDTPDEAFQRYVDTINGVGSWYMSDQFKEGTWGFEQLKYVRSLHNLVRRGMNENSDQEKVRRKTRLGGNFTGCPMSAGLRRDLDHLVQDHCPFGGGKVFGDVKQGLYMNQYDMAITQWSFVGPAILFPDRYGIANATEEELDGFVHLWEVLGYALGIDDRYNFCQGGLRATLRRSRQALAGVVLPSIRRAPPPWEYMTRCLADGLGYLLPGIDYETMLANMLRDTLDAPSSSLEASFTDQQKIAAASYSGLLKSLVKDQRGLLWRPVGALGRLLMLSAKAIPKKQMKKLRHRPPHRADGCYPTLRP